ncbi:MAG: permease [Clostridia bacterium]|nr:permease [Clostridia bacterium]
MHVITKTMRKPSGLNFLKIILLLAFIAAIVGNIDTALAVVHSKTMLNLRTMFISLVLESFPFLLLGSVVSAVLEVFVSENTLARWLPRATLPGLLVAASLGLLFPLCECGIVIIAARLARKKVPVHLVTTFMLAVPLVNVIVILSTRMAFPASPMLAYRLIGALGIAIISGCLMKVLLDGQNILNEDLEPLYCCSCEDAHLMPGKPKMTAVLTQSIEEFFNMGNFFVMGAFLSSLLQVAIPRDLISSLGNGGASSVLAMMALAFGLSICSNADAFIANALSTTFSTGSIASFLIYGAMIDLKNIFMLFGQFKKRYVLTLVFVVTVLAFTYGLGINLLGGR